MGKTFTFFFALMLPLAARAQDPAAEACAHRLPAEARSIYEAAALLITKNADIRSVLRRETIALVKAGKAARKTAPDSAMAASLCLKRLNP
jgi:hypothetical protein